LLWIPFFSIIAVAIGPPPQTYWTVGEPFSPVGFYNVSQPEGEGHGYEFTVLNGTSASVTIPIMPTKYAESFPLNLNLSVRASTIKDGQYLSTGLRNVSAVLVPNIVTLKNPADSVNVTMIFTAKKNAADTLYEIQLGMWSGSGPSSGLGALYHFRIRSTNMMGTSVTATTTITSTTTTTTSITQVSTATTVATVTQVETIMNLSIYTWAISASTIAIILAVIALRRRG
jgi:hypothetical protein